LRGPTRLASVQLSGSVQLNIKSKSAAGVPILEKHPNVAPGQFAVVEGVLVVKVAS